VKRDRIATVPTHECKVRTLELQMTHNNSTLSRSDTQSFDHLLTATKQNASQETLGFTT
jgi:hypothetical protein